MGKAITFYIKDFRGRTVDDFIKYLQQLGMRVFLPPVNVCNKMLDTEGEVKIDIIFDEEKGQWISVKDKLPEKDVGVLVYTRNRFVSTLVHEDIDYLEENGEFHRYNGNQYISHWMPLPEPPESEDEE